MNRVVRAWLQALASVWLVAYLVHVIPHEHVSAWYGVPLVFSISMAIVGLNAAIWFAPAPLYEGWREAYRKAVILSGRLPKSEHTKAWIRGDSL